MISQDFTIYTSEDWAATIALPGAGDLTGATALMQVRLSADHPDDLVDLSSTPDSNDEGNSFTLNVGAKTVALAIPQDAVAEFVPGSYVYDVLVIYAAGARKREAEGRVFVKRGITDAVRADPVYVLDVGGAVLETG
ncbi:hypothetical protein [Tardiphaga sp.]|uniref:hypothetical protein n=1 Tax=Tardiphaga sp. TaxID=1926292 RepID=UPI002633B1D6|nr:hypothetical protein [Tardiphaga sp.]MDB5620766.1 hypothetical protein [Tardiphaga sp.]